MEDKIAFNQKIDQRITAVNTMTDEQVEAVSFALGKTVTKGTLVAELESEKFDI